VLVNGDGGLGRMLCAAREERKEGSSGFFIMKMGHISKDGLLLSLENFNSLYRILSFIV